MRSQFSLALAIALLVTACDRAPGAPPASRSAPVAPSAIAPARFVERAEAIALVRALPEVKKLSEVTIETGTKRRQIELVIQPVRDADEACRDGSCEPSWEIAVGDREAWDGARVREEGMIDIHARIGARDGSVRLRDGDEKEFLEEAVWRARRLAQARAQRIIQATPEWHVEARAAARTPGTSLGLMLDEAPAADCASADGGDGGCHWRYMALSVCGGCAGHWTRFDVDAERETLFEVNLLDNLPYSIWRSVTRREAAKAAAYRELVGPKERFPDVKAGDGPLGYGAPSSVVTDVTTFHHPTRDVIEAERLMLVRVERYRKDEYPVFFVEASGPFPTREKGTAVRAFAARLVRKNGGFACELSIGATGARYQFDRHAGESGDGGIYVLIDGAFHPWIGA